jgi:cytoskeleton protein RodZ
MTANESTTRVVSDSGDDIGPGQRLREAREAAQLSLAEVASRMRLEPRVLASLEGDHYERLHGPTFVRGYLSGYARLLNLPERPILEAYERHDHRPPALVSELGRKPEVHVSDFPVRMVTYVIAGLLVVLVVLWWQSRQLHTGAPERADGTAASTGGAQSAHPAVTVETEQAVPALAEPAAEVAEPQPSEPVIATAAVGAGTMPVEPLPSANAPTGESPAPAQAGAMPADLPPADAPQATTGATAGAAADDAGESAGHVSDPAQQPAALALEASASAAGGDISSASNVAEEAAPVPRPLPLPGSDRLAIQLAKESWVEIYDRGGGRLYYSLAGEGSEVVVEGAGPMRVLLGEIAGAAVAYNGEPFDLSRFQGRSVVRFTVGESSNTTTPESPAPVKVEEPLTRETRHPSSGQLDRSVADASGALAAPTPSAETERKHPLPAPANSGLEIPLDSEQPDS